MMTKQTLLSLFGAAFLLAAAPDVTVAARPAAGQTTSSKTAAKKKHTSSKSKKKSSKVKGQSAPAPDRIKEIQSALQKDGSFEGEPTGKWDAATADAMRKYQDKNGFPATGKIDAQSLNKLGLGSETAGKGAPMPTASSAVEAADPPSK